MEAVHKSEKRMWIDHKTTNVREFLEKWKDALSFETCMSTGNETGLKSLVSEEGYKKIEEDCGLAALRCQYQDKVEPSNSITIPTGVTLKTVQAQAEDLKKRESSMRYHNAVYNAMKYCNYPPHKILSSLTDVNRIPHEPVITPEVVLSVQFFVPERRLETKLATPYSKLPTFQLDQEFLVLGCQALCELRDKIECVSDKAIPGELSDCPNNLPTHTCKDLYKSGFFYISGTFYNDMRDGNCRDYSETILKWAESRKELGPFKKGDMEKTKFIDLDIQLGYPYVYIHQGDCEHLMVFSDLRLFSKHDFDNRNAYPLYVQIKPTKRIFCMICRIYTASWVVYDNKRLPENPFFFCKNCFISFNYDKNDQKIGHFRAYYFPDRSKLM